MRIVMVGTGYVGLVTGACLAESGHEVACIDNDSSKIDLLNGGELPIYEPGLLEIVTSGVQGRRLSFSTDLRPHVRRADAVFIAVGTPSRQQDGCADLSYVYAAAREIASALPRTGLVVIKSTVPVGTGDEVAQIVNELHPGLDCAVASNPEFLRAGAAVHDFKQPDRIIIGTEEEHARETISEIYRPFESSGAPVLHTRRRTAELIKYATNAFLATKLAFINEISDLCEKVGADVQDIAHAMGLDRRIGPQFLNAGPGFGGSCFPKDALALIKTAQDNEAPLHIVETVVAVNQTRKRAMARKVAAMVGGSVRGRSVALLGLTFKPNTDDMREAPSLALITALTDMGARVRAYDPAGMNHAKSIFPSVTFCESAYHAAKDADALVVVTEWDQFRGLSLARLKRLMSRPVIVDLRNIYRPEDMIRHGFSYHRVGSPSYSIPASTAPLPTLHDSAGRNGRTSAIAPHLNDAAIALRRPSTAGKTQPVADKSFARNRSRTARAAKS
jgi:UDPglucose 6-dehydrogenase